MLVPYFNEKDVCDLCCYVVLPTLHRFWHFKVIFLTFIENIKSQLAGACCSSLNALVFAIIDYPFRYLRRH